MGEITTVLPERALDALADGLVRITAAIDEIAPARVAHGFLGGEHGYGGHWNSDVFMMRPFCWCERDECPWCMGCNCPPESTHFYVDGVEVSSCEWGDFFDRETYQKLSGGAIKSFADSLGEGAKRYYTHDQWMRAADVANSRRSETHDPVCAYCVGGLHDDVGFAPGKGAPNFWHKPTGLRVWWYKYIGRSQEALAPKGVKVEAIISECLADIRKLPTPTGGRDG
ncbi:hypothetical protein Q0812_13165 [Brevundimonas sp. 2R-24]|uniref:Uncharacterized protein n=1 Tax=Peiella sedimenti TaxID=3061083 RepID=A0ABT8SRB0_9CAUL|nr:hypothetical protein [Caulobacteraceae bacterium XZ-24]